MKKQFLIILLFVSYNSFSQDYSFLSKNYFKIDKHQFNEIIRKYAKTTYNSYLENGKVFTKAYSDSIGKSIIKYTQLIYADTINHKMAFVFKKMTEEEIKTRKKESIENSNENQKYRNKLIGTSIEKLFLTDMDGNKYSLETLKGKTIVLNFWFTKCKPCIKEMPKLNKMKEKFKSDEVVFFAITFNKKDEIQQFLKKTMLDFTIVPNGQATINQFKINTFPTNILINKEGIVEYVNEVLDGNGIEEINKILKKLVKNNCI